MTTALEPIIHSGPFAGRDTCLVLVRQPTFSEWDALGCWLRAAGKSLPWLVGDWMNFGEAIFGEQAAQAYEAAEATGWTLRTLEVYAWVCRMVPPERRRKELSFQHHQIVASLDAQTQTKWLAAAATDPDGPWSTRELKTAIAKANGKAPQTWVLVGALDAADAEWLCGKMLGEGRAAKVVSR